MQPVKLNTGVQKCSIVVVVVLIVLIATDKTNVCVTVCLYWANCHFEKDLRLNSINGSLFVYKHFCVVCMSFC